MSTRTRDAIDPAFPPSISPRFPRRMESPWPRPRTTWNRRSISCTCSRQPLAPRGHHVGGNLLIYWDPTDGWKHLAPDLLVALDAGPDHRESWKVGLEGKFPEVIFEIASPCTRNRDIGAKVAMYGDLGARVLYRRPARSARSGLPWLRAARRPTRAPSAPDGGRHRQSAAVARATRGGRLAAGDRSRVRPSLSHAPRGVGGAAG
jgi:hypothetical protein